MSNPTISDGVIVRGPLFAAKYDRPWLRYIETPEPGDGGAGAGEGGEGKPEGQFTQADVDRIVRERLQQQAKNKFGDYDQLKAKADESQTLEQRLATLEGELTTTKAAALRTQIASEFGISTKKGAKGEPSDADLFLTGADEATLTAQAQRLAAATADRKKNGNVARNEGDTKQNDNAGTGDLREFARGLFGGDD